MRKDYVKIQKDIANERIEVIEGAFIRVVIGLVILIMTMIISF